jgi:small subunit ribosomal protein S4
MSRYRGPRLRIIRRLGKGVVLPGLTTKNSIKQQPPGKPRAADNKRQKETECGTRSTEKPKTKIQLWIN